MKRIAGYSALLAAIVLGGFAVREVRAAVSVAPSQTSVTAGQPSLITIQYRFSGLLGPGAVPPPYTGIEDSPVGTFLAPDMTPLGTVPTAVIANIVNGAGAATEALTVPASVIDAAIRGGLNQITYERAFAGASNSPTTRVGILIASSDAVGPLRLKRIELYFGNRRGETTVGRNQRGLKAFADIRFAGSGVLSGFWEVDGRRILDVNRQLIFGTGVTLSTPDIPDLPTFDTGTHIVRFVVASPAPPEPLPQLLYFVTPATELRTIRITALESDKDAGERPGRTFTWEKPPGIELFFLEFSEEPGGKPVFSAFTRETRYALRGKGVEGIFVPGKRYYWRLKGYDAGGEQVAESAPATFLWLGAAP